MEARRGSGRCAIVATASRLLDVRSSRGFGYSERRARFGDSAVIHVGRVPGRPRARRERKSRRRGFERHAYLREETVEAVQQVGVSPKQSFHALDDLAGIGPVIAMVERSAREGGGRKRG